MKGTTLRFILIVIIPSIILIGVGIYFIFQIPQVRLGSQKYIMNIAIDRSVRKGKLSQANANQLKEALDRFFEVLIKMENSQIDEEAIEKVIEEVAVSMQIGTHWGVPNDDEVKEVVDFFNKISQRLEKLLEDHAANPAQNKE